MYKTLSILLYLYKDVVTLITRYFNKLDMILAICLKNQLNMNYLMKLPCMDH
jgi:hypothetical protein